MIPGRGEPPGPPVTAKISAYGAGTPRARARRGPPRQHSSSRAFPAEIPKPERYLVQQVSPGPVAVQLFRLRAPVTRARAGSLVGWRHMPAYDAFLLLSFGGPEGPDDVLPFLENVTRGRGVPAERLAEVAGALLRRRRRQPDQRPVPGPARARSRPRCARRHGPAALLGEQELAPVLDDTVRQMARRRRAARDRVRDLRLQLLLGLPPVPGRHRARGRGGRGGPGAPRIDKIRPYFNHPGFIEPFAAERRSGAAPACRRRRQAGARLVFTAHSVPVGMAAASGSASAGTAVPGRRRQVRGRAAGGFPAYHRTDCVVAPWPATWSSRAAAARRACPGWNRT